MLFRFAARPAALPGGSIRNPDGADQEPLWCFRPPGATIEETKRRNREAEVFEEMMVNVHKQWLAEFDREQATRRSVPRQRRRITAWAALLQLVRRRRQERQPAVARRLPQASQCL
jgi:hypothetical protein